MGSREGVKYLEYTQVPGDRGEVHLGLTCETDAPMLLQEDTPAEGSSQSVCSSHFSLVEIIAVGLPMLLAVL